MKTIRPILLAAASLALASCAGLSGYQITFDGQGNAIIAPPPYPIVIPAK